MTSASLAAEFAARLRAELTPDQIAEVNRRNATPQYQNGSCASHDFCDANMPMAEAFEASTGKEVDPSSETDARLWNAAWEAARRAGFDPKQVDTA